MQVAIVLVKMFNVVKFVQYYKIYQDNIFQKTRIEEISSLFKIIPPFDDSDFLGIVICNFLCIHSNFFCKNSIRIYFGKTNITILSS